MVLSRGCIPEQRLELMIDISMQELLLGAYPVRNLRSKDHVISTISLARLLGG